MIALVVLTDTQSLQRRAGHGERNRCHQALRNSQWWTTCCKWRTCSPAAFSRAGRLAREELVGVAIKSLECRWPAIHCQPTCRWCKAMPGLQPSSC